MAHLDPTTGRPRGFMRLGRHSLLDSVLFTLDVRDSAWRQVRCNARGVMWGACVEVLRGVFIMCC